MPCWTSSFNISVDFICPYNCGEVNTEFILEPHISTTLLKGIPSGQTNLNTGLICYEHEGEVVEYDK